MDTSETYIKMRLTAVSDLGMGTPPSGDFHHLKDDEDIWVSRDGNFYYFAHGKCCQLERQDQLQEMRGGFEAGFIDWFYWRNAVYPHMQNPFNKGWHFTSMEQLWLAFVMKVKYGKVWTDGDWKHHEAY